jgi:hypothetical protein
MSDETTGDQMTGADANPQMDTTVDATQGANANPNDASSSTTDTSSGVDQTSTAEPAEQQPEQPPSQPAPKPSYDYEKGYKSLLPEYQKTRHEFKQMQQQLAQFQQEQQKQQQASQLKPWQKGHPEVQKFNGLLNKARLVGQQIQSIQRDTTLADDVKNQMVQRLNGTLSEEEHKQLESYRADREDFTTNFHADPKGTIVDVAREAAMEVFRQGMMSQRADADVGSWFDQNQEVVSKYGPMMREAINMAETGNTWPVAQKLAMMAAENEKLREQLASQATHVEAAAAQSEVLNRSAGRITQRDPRTARMPDDLANIAREHGANDPTSIAALAARRMKF